MPSRCVCFASLPPRSRADPAAAAQVLELDPTTFAPTLALKYGRLLRPSPSAAAPAGTLRIELHPDCLPPAGDDADWYGEWEEEDEEVDEVAGALRAKPKIRFGEDLFMAQGDDEGEGGGAQGEGEGVWEGEWATVDARLVAAV